MAGKNPFPSVPDPADEEPPFDPDPTPDPETPSNAKAAQPYSVPDIYPTGEVGVSFKLGTEFEAPMIHFKAATLEGLADLVGFDRNGLSGTELLQGVGEYAAEASKFLTGTYTSVTGRKLSPVKYGAGNGGSNSTGGGGGRKGAPPNVAEPPAWMGEAPLCKGHDEPTKYVSRVKANGDRWHAWGCSREQGESCGLKFHNAPKANSK
jgi:hypothetical protein